MAEGGSELIPRAASPALGPALCGEEGEGKAMFPYHKDLMGHLGDLESVWRGRDKCSGVPGRAGAQMKKEAGGQWNGLLGMGWPAGPFWGVPRAGPWALSWNDPGDLRNR